jgi:hypothetical protein
MLRDTLSVALYEYLAWRPLALSSFSFLQFNLLLLRQSLVATILTLDSYG